VEFNELLLENVDLFVDIVVDWRTRFLDHPMIGVSERECSIIATLLNTDKRWVFSGIV
jgi:hypothetical protein